jgi:hypothetical protein
MAKGGQPQKNATSARMKVALKRLDEGDVVTARREAHALLTAPEAPADADEAKALLDRLKIPKEIFLFAALAATVLTLLVILAIVRSY